MHRFFRKDNIVSVLSHKQSFFRLIGQCVFRGKEYNLQNYSRIYTTTFVFFYINDTPQALSDSNTYLYADDTTIFLST